MSLYLALEETDLMRQELNGVQVGEIQANTGLLGALVKEVLS